MGLDVKSHCPECDTEADVQTVDEYGFAGSVVHASSEELVIEVGCKNPDCIRVWRAVYSFIGNQ